MSNNSLQLFEYSGHQVRTVLFNGQPGFVAADLCKILDIKNSRDALASLDLDEKGVATIDTPGGQQQMQVVNEPGMYSLVLRSRKPEARNFKRWITHEVLPQIRATGSYSVPKTLEQRSLEIIGELTQVVQDQQLELEEARPKADAYDSFMDSDGTYSVGNVAKMLGFSQNKLFTELRNHGVFIGKGHMRNTPYQQYMHHFAVKAYSYTRSDGNEGTSYTTRVQPSGVDFIRKKLSLEEDAA